MPYHQAMSVRAAAEAGSLSVPAAVADSNSPSLGIGTKWQRRHGREGRHAARRTHQEGGTRKRTWTAGENKRRKAKTDHVHVPPIPPSHSGTNSRPRPKRRRADLQDDDTTRLVPDRAAGWPACPPERVRSKGGSIPHFLEPKSL